MPQVAIPHVIGTVMLLGLLGIVTFYVNDLNLHTRLDTARVQLRDVSEYVSSEIISLINIAYIGHNSTVIYHELNIPREVNGFGYVITLVKKGDIWVVRTYLDMYPSVKADSYLYLSEGVNISIVSNRIPLNSNDTIITDNKIYSGVEHPVVWCRIDGMNITIGIGKREVVS